VTSAAFWLTLILTTAGTGCCSSSPVVTPEELRPPLPAIRPDQPTQEDLQEWRAQGLAGWISLGAALREAWLYIDALERDGLWAEPEAETGR
jgi:hypothetical protein